MHSAHEFESIWRYPVKSMAGEELEETYVSARGPTGDRAYALMDPSTRKFASAKIFKRFGELLKSRASFIAAPAANAPLPAARITLSDGMSLTSDQPDAAERIRPNLVVGCGEESGFTENDWVRRTVVVGPTSCCAFRSHARAT